MIRHAVAAFLQGQTSKLVRVLGVFRLGGAYAVPRWAVGRKAALQSKRMGASPFAASSNKITGSIAGNSVLPAYVCWAYKNTWASI